MSQYEAEKRINELMKVLSESREELSEEDKRYAESLKVVNASDIKEPWKYPKWGDQMRKIRRGLYRSRLRR